jgi:hypothetical protein
VKELLIDVAEILLHHLQIFHIERMLIGRSNRWRQPAVQVDDRIMRERLEKDGRAARPERSRNVRQRLSKIQMMKDRDSAYQVEAVRGHLQVFGVHHRESDTLHLFASRALPCLGDRHTRNVDPQNVGRSLLCHEQRIAVLPAADLEHAAAPRMPPQVITIETMTAVKDQIKLRNLMPAPAGKRSVVELRLCLLFRLHMPRALLAIDQVVPVEFCSEQRWIGFPGSAAP